jgi:hypothetical protein
MFENNPECFKFSAHAAIQCRTGAGVSAGKHDAKATVNYSDCAEGVTQCKLSGKKALGKFIFFGIFFVKATHVFATKTFILFTMQVLLCTLTAVVKNISGQQTDVKQALLVSNATALETSVRFKIQLKKKQSNAEQGLVLALEAMMPKLTLSIKTVGRV